MTAPIDRLRAADPASALDPQPDERAEADLRLLLAEPEEPAGVRAPSASDRRRRAPVLVTTVVALVLLALTVAALAAIRPRVDVGGSTPPTAGTSRCRPAQVLPFQCGTYESTSGGRAVTGDLGGPAKDRLRISYTQQDGALLLTASTVNCFAERVLVRFDGKRLIRVGKPDYSENDCNGPAADRRSWAYAFLNGPLKTSDGATFSLGSDSEVVFEYQGVAPIGEQQLPRNDLTCVPAHVAPFSCDDYRSVGGTGTLAFLGSHPATLRFAHLNGQLTVGLAGWCNSLDSVIATDGAALVSYGVGGTQRACGRMPGPGAQESTPELRDDAWRGFFTGVLTYRVSGNEVVFEKGSSSATFTR